MSHEWKNRESILKVAQAPSKVAQLRKFWRSFSIGHFCRRKGARAGRAAGLLSPEDFFFSLSFTHP
jgi:hypothetical protein